MSLRVRPDLEASHFPPPAEVAADPQRLAIWRRNQGPTEGEHRLYQVTGCGHQALYDCWVSDWGRADQSSACVDARPAKTAAP